MSRRIADMEAACGQPLLERLPRGVVPTEAGLAVAEHARRVVSLPAANWLYARLEPILGKDRRAIIVEHDAATRQALGEMHQQARLP